MHNVPSHDQVKFCLLAKVSCHSKRCMKKSISGPSREDRYVSAGVIGYTVRPNFRSGGPYSLREYGPPRTQLPREYGPCKILYIQGIQSGGGGGLNSLTDRRFDFDNHWYTHSEKRGRSSPKSQPLAFDNHW